MELDEYQRRARETDQNPKLGDSAEASRIAQNCDVIPLLGLVGEVARYSANTRSYSEMAPHTESSAMKWRRNSVIFCGMWRTLVASSI
jgi:hypothetical protein